MSDPRELLQDIIERALAMLDALDGDPDREPDTDAEPDEENEVEEDCDQQQMMGGQGL